MSSLIKKILANSYLVSRESYLVKIIETENQNKFVSRIGYWVKKEKEKYHSSFCLTIPIKFTLINKAFYNFLKVYLRYFFVTFFFSY